MRHIWDRRPGESDQSFARFNMYLSSGPSRPTMRQFAERLGLKPNTVRGISHRHDWVPRAAAFDQHKAETDVDNMDEFRARTNRLRVEIAEMGLTILRDAFDGLAVSDPREAQAVASTIKTVLEPIVGTKDGEDAAKAIEGGGWVFNIGEVNAEQGRRERLMAEAGLDPNAGSGSAGDTGSVDGASEPEA